ncbi:MAG: hypothetical protein HC848_07830 [Limnobacter sp.]|nr:hypothetical protein [Limnobacter sp.]
MLAQSQDSPTNGKSLHAKIRLDSESRLADEALLYLLEKCSQLDSHGNPQVSRADALNEVYAA